MPVSDLPVLLPDVENYKPGADGRSPLASIAEFVNVECPMCGAPAQRETDTMAGSVDSSWYFLRFTSPRETGAAWSRPASDYWMNVDRYLGGREHAVGHLLYARFFQKVFFDAGLVSHDEPFQSLRNQGMLLAYTPVDAGSSDKKYIPSDELIGYDFAAWVARYESEGAFAAVRRIRQQDDTFREEPVRVEFAWLKMSKSKRNAVTPDEIAGKYGADALRMYVCFEAPFEDTIQWDESRMNGTARFLARVYDTVTEIAPAFDPAWHTKIATATTSAEADLRRRTHQAVAKVGADLEALAFNTAVSALMIFADALRKFVQSSGVASPAAHEGAETLVKLLAPLAPHIADELFEKLGYTNRFLYTEAFPVYDAAAAAASEVTVVVQVNGKLRDKLTLPADADEAVCEAAAMASDKVQADLVGKTIRKVVVVPGRLVNIVAN
ncbi:MAG: class I tRNA ligase family protein [Armatimonadetes bacterium]|nr:class I tRNA ligase family protein [Armatimonadota bacterium]